MVLVSDTLGAVLVKLVEELAALLVLVGTELGRLTMI